MLLLFLPQNPFFDKNPLQTQKFAGDFSFEGCGKSCG
jgi:hypothetical protein